MTKTFFDKNLNLKFQLYNNCSVSLEQILNCYTIYFRMKFQVELFKTTKWCKRQIIKYDISVIWNPNKGQLAQVWPFLDEIRVEMITKSSHLALTVFPLITSVSSVVICGEKTCKNNEYCVEDGFCSSCEDICQTSSHNYDEVTCRNKCSGKLTDAIFSRLLNL